jgi:hypothetical protein
MEFAPAALISPLKSRNYLVDVLEYLIGIIPIILWNRKVDISLIQRNHTKELELVLDRRVDHVGTTSIMVFPPNLDWSIITREALV